MPHMSNLPWMQTYFMIIILILTIMLFFYFSSPLVSQNKKITNKFSMKAWKW